MGITAHTARARIKWPRQQQIPVGGRIQIFKDARDGVVDYEAPINRRPVEAWPLVAGVLAGKIGFGRGRYGRGPFGRSEGGFGFGRGPFGRGPFGRGGPWHRVEGGVGFLTNKLADGTWEFGVVGYDRAGNPATAKEVAGVVLAGTPEPPTDVEAESYAGGVLTLAWTVSTDDDT